MKFRRRSVLIAVLAVALISTGFFHVASADDSTLNDDQIARIRGNCSIVKSTLNQLHVADALLRVNRGQLYESTTTKLMVPFNARLVSNHVDAADLVSATSSYSLALTAFRTDYQSYEVQLSGTLNIDCTKEPVTFYDSLLAAETKRATVHADTVKLNGYIDTYKTGIETLLNTYSPTPGVTQ